MNMIRYIEAGRKKEFSKKGRSFTKKEIVFNACR